jgi:hypothetical protein
MQAKKNVLRASAGLVAGISASTVYCTSASTCGALKGGSRCCFFGSAGTWKVFSTSPLPLLLGCSTFSTSPVTLALLGNQILPCLVI